MNAPSVGNIIDSENIRPGMIGSGTLSERGGALFFVVQTHPEMELSLAVLQSEDEQLPVFRMVSAYSLRDRVMVDLTSRTRVTPTAVGVRHFKPLWHRDSVPVGSYVINGSEPCLCFAFETNPWLFSARTGLKVDRTQFSSPFIASEWQLEIQFADGELWQNIVTFQRAGS